MDFHERANSLIKNTLLSIEKWDSLIYSTKRLSLINNSELSNISALKNIKLPETAITLYYIFHQEECDNDGFVKEGFLGTLVDVANSLSVHIHHKSLIPMHVSVYIDTYFVQKIKKDQGIYISTYIENETHKEVRMFYRITCALTGETMSWGNHYKFKLPATQEAREKHKF